jgi:hypothetical protein
MKNLDRRLGLAQLNECNSLPNPTGTQLGFVVYGTPVDDFVRSLIILFRCEPVIVILR